MPNRTRPALDKFLPIPPSPTAFEIMINPLKSIDINVYRYTHPRVDPRHQGFRIAQISDVHLGRWVKPRHMRQVVDFINQRNPDLVALTGDYVGYNHRDLEPSIATLAGLSTRTVAVLGNHDHWTSTEAATAAFADADIPLLSNRAMLLDYNGRPLEIVGVDDEVTNNADAEKAFAEARGDTFCLTLNHAPSIADDLVQRGAHLVLSGHTHGHQFNIPGITHRIADTLGVNYHVGAYHIDGSFLYINRGLGSASWPWRIGAAPELTFFELAHGPRARLELLESDDFGVEHRPDS